MRWINGVAGQFPALDAVMMAIAEGTPALIAATWGLLWFWPGAGRTHLRHVVVWSVLAVLLALGLKDIFALFYYRNRPWMDHGINLLVRQLPSSAFPAEHVSAVAAFSALLSGWARAPGYLAWAFTWADAYARVYIGVHYPSDVLVGAFLGWAVGALIQHDRLLLRGFARRVVRRVECLRPFSENPWQVGGRCSLSLTQRGMRISADSENPGPTDRGQGRGGPYPALARQYRCGVPIDPPADPAGDEAPGRPHLRSGR